MRLAYNQLKSPLYVPSCSGMGPPSGLFQYLEVLEEQGGTGPVLPAWEEQSVSVSLSGNAVCRGGVGAEAGTPGWLQLWKSPPLRQAILPSQPLLRWPPHVPRGCCPTQDFMLGPPSLLM